MEWELINMFFESVLTKDATIALVLNWLFVENFKSELKDYLDTNRPTTAKLYKLIVPYKAMISWTIFTWLTFSAMWVDYTTSTVFFYWFVVGILTIAAHEMWLKHLPSLFKKWEKSTK